MELKEHYRLEQQQLVHYRKEQMGHCKMEQKGHYRKELQLQEHCK